MALVAFIRRHPTFLLGLILFASIFLIGRIGEAANLTVCNSGCDYTTITDAINSATLGVGDSIFVGADYASTTETFPFNVPTGVNLDCQNSGAVIGTDDESNRVYINSQSDNIIQNCTFSNVGIQNTNQSNVQILHSFYILMLQLHLLV